MHILSRRFGIGSDSRYDTLILGLVNAAPYFACVTFACWLTVRTSYLRFGCDVPLFADSRAFLSQQDPLNHYFGRKGTILITLVFVSCIYLMMINSSCYANVWNPFYAPRLHSLVSGLVCRHHGKCWWLLESFFRLVLVRNQLQSRMYQNRLCSINCQLRYRPVRQCLRSRNGSSRHSRFSSYDVADVDSIWHYDWIHLWFDLLQRPLRLYWRPQLAFDARKWLRTSHHRLRPSAIPSWVTAMALTKEEDKKSIRIPQ